MGKSGVCVAKTRRANHNSGHARESPNVSGFMWHQCQRFESFVFEGAIDTNVVISCFDLNARQLEKETVIVIDNAPIHRSAEFEEKFQEWAELGLEINYLPAYCPNLNMIEMFWKKIKYEWLSWEAYTSYKTCAKN